MAKFNVSTQTGGPSASQLAAIEKVARQPDETVVDTPVEQIEQQIVEPTTDPFVLALEEEAGQPLTAPQAAQQIFSPGTEAAIEETVDPDQAAQREAERVAPLRQRIEGFDEYKINKDNPIGGLASRAMSVWDGFKFDAEKPTAGVTAWAKPAELSTIQQDPTVDPFEGKINPISTLANQESFDAATVNDQGGIDVDPAFAFVMTAATEHFFSNSSARLDGDQFVEEVDAELDAEPSAEESVTKAKGNARLGKTIWQEWMREKAAADGAPSDQYLLERRPPKREELEYIGDLAKEAYANAVGEDYVKRVKSGGQVQFQPTKFGLANMRAAHEAGGKPFDNQEVAPLGAPSPTGQPQYEAKTYTREAVTVLAPQPKSEGKNLNVINEAKNNLHQMGLMVDSRAEGIIYAHGIPAARDAIAYYQEIEGMDYRQEAPESTPYANMFGVGDVRLGEVFGEKLRLETEISIAQNALAEAEANGDWSVPFKRSKLEKAQQAFEEYDPFFIYKQDINKFIESLNTIAKYQGRVNYQTYYTQMLTGRLGMQQNKFNPQTNKLVRFAARQADVPVEIRPDRNGFAEKNFKEIGAVYFLEGKTLHPEERIRKFNAAMESGALAKYIDIGNDLINNSPDKAAIEKGRGLVASIVPKQRDAGNFINLGPLANSDNAGPQYKDATNEFFADHDAEEIPYLMEYVMDLARFAQGQPFRTTFEAEMDGITHGVSSNGAALGIENTMERAGAIHIGGEKQLVSSGRIQGDLRKQMAERMHERMGDVGGDFANQGHPIEVLTAIAKEAVKDRPNYLKKAPMTFGYGQDLKNLTGAVQDTMYTGEFSGNIQTLIKENSLDPAHVSAFLHSLLVDTLVDTLQPRAIRAARQLRANNLLATITGEPLYYDNAMGFRSWIGAKAPIEREERQRSELKVGGRSAPVYHYKEELHGAAPRQREGGREQPGGWGHGRVIPAVVQAYDGNMIARTASGQSHKKMSEVAKARGHKHGWLPIFDAGKTNLANLDLVREEMNRNWWEGIERKSYVEDIMGKGGWAAKTLEKARKDLMNADQPISLFEGKFRGVGNTFFTDGSEKLVAKLFESVYPYQNTEFFVDSKKLEADAKDRAKKLLKQLQGMVKDADKAQPSEVLAVINLIENTFKVQETNRTFSAEVEAARKKAFPKVKKRAITQVDLG